MKKRLQLLPRKDIVGVKYIELENKLERDFQENRWVNPTFKYIAKNIYNSVYTCQRNTHT